MNEAGRCPKAIPPWRFPNSGGFLMEAETFPEQLILAIDKWFRFQSVHWITVWRVPS